jgi:hypothetical protein
VSFRIAADLLLTVAKILICTILSPVFFTLYLIQELKGD